MTKKILIDETVVKQALEWIEDATVVLSHTSTAIQGGLGAEAEGVGGCSVKVLKELREALEENNKGVNALAEQQAAEPVAWISEVRCVGPEYGKKRYGALPIQSLQPGYYAHTPLYASPRPSKPLTDERLSEIESRILQEGGSYAEVLRAVADEAAHTGSKT